MNKGILVSVFLLAHSGLFGNTTAYSPSTPGQPLIFHKTTPTAPPFEHNIPPQQLIDLSLKCVRLGEDFLGLAGVQFLPIQEKQRLSVKIVFNNDITTSIGLIVKDFTSKELAQLINQTLTSFKEITNKMLDNTINVPTNKLYHKDYLQMQEQVINEFKAGLGGKTAPEAVYALEGLVSCMALFISDLNSIVEGGQPGSKNMVLARQQVVGNLTQFVIATFALQTQQRKCICHAK